MNLSSDTSQAEFGGTPLKFPTSPIVARKTDRDRQKYCLAAAIGALCVLAGVGALWWSVAERARYNTSPRRSRVARFPAQRLPRERSTRSSRSSLARTIPVRSKIFMRLQHPCQGRASNTLMVRRRIKPGAVNDFEIRNLSQFVEDQIRQCDSEAKK